ncbi:MAG: hypothetical protein KME26_01435 [Oscillatoria princeps RMCB-10]|jgi:hypothetical protein|nr:hypothetical protein [Oscillatoria princeps RMCB-10]
MIHASVKELRNAFYAHLAAYEKIKNHPGPSYLLLFYAAECGMKTIWLSRKSFKTTEQIFDETLLSGHGHNLETWRVKLIEIKLMEDSAVRKAPRFSLGRDKAKKAQFDIGKAHQAWRYGIGLNTEDEKDLVEWLNKICNWIKENI